MNTGTWASIAPGPSPSEGIRRAVAASTKAHSSALRYSGLYLSRPAGASLELARNVRAAPVSATPAPDASMKVLRLGGEKSDIFSVPTSWCEHLHSQVVGGHSVVLKSDGFSWASLDGAMQKEGLMQVHTCTHRSPRQTNPKRAHTSLILQC